MANLISAMEVIQEQARVLFLQKQKEIEIIESAYKSKTAELASALKALKELNTACLKCKGVGKIMEYSNIPDDRGIPVKCDKCNGTGNKGVSE